MFSLVAEIASGTTTEVPMKYVAFKIANVARQQMRNVDSGNTTKHKER